MRVSRAGKQFGVFAVAGVVAGAVVVVGGGQTMTPSTVPPTSWYGLLVGRSATSAGGQAFGFVLFGGVAALVVLWVCALRAAERGDFLERRVWLLGGLWAAPFIAGPPIISKDVHAYVAQGVLSYRGGDPYSSGVSALSGLHNVGADRVLAAVDPQWRTSLSPYGPIATVIEREAARISGGDAVGTLIVLRAVAVFSVVLLAYAAASLSGERRAVGIVCVVLNPLVLIHVVSGVHLEAEMAALLLTGVFAARRQMWAAAIVLVCAAGSVKAPAFAALPILIVAHLHQRLGSWPGRLARTALLDLGIGAASTAAFAALTPNGFGWVGNLSTPAHGISSSFSGAVLRVLEAITPDTWAGETRIVVSAAMLVVAAAVIGRVTLSAGSRPVEVSVGIALVTLAALLPVFYPWYLLWGVVLLLIAARGAQRDQMVALCGVISVLGATGTPAPVAQMVDVLAAVTGLLWLRYRRSSSSDVVKDATTSVSGLRAKLSAGRLPDWSTARSQRVPAGAERSVAARAQMGTRSHEQIEGPAIVLPEAPNSGPSSPNF